MMRLKPTDINRIAEWNLNGKKGSYVHVVETDKLREVLQDLNCDLEVGIKAREDGEDYRYKRALIYAIQAIEERFGVLFK